ncbi:MAG: hypothetical protein R2726_04310 [Acidimicrobiales bacterium]
MAVASSAGAPPAPPPEPRPPGGARRTFGGLQPGVRVLPARIAGRLPYPTRRLAAVVAVAAVVLLAANVGWAFLVVNAVLVGVALTDWALATSPNEVRIDRRLPRVIALHVRGDLTWTVHNPSGRTLHVGFADDLAPRCRPATAGPV